MESLIKMFVPTSHFIQKIFRVLLPYEIICPTTVLHTRSQLIHSVLIKITNCDRNLAGHQLMFYSLLDLKRHPLCHNFNW